MALIDVNPEFVVQACKKIRSYLEDIRSSIETHPEGPVVTLDFDAIGQLLTPYSRRSSYAGLLWHSVLNIAELEDIKPPLSLSVSSDAPMPLHLARRVQIPAGAKQELRYFCRRLLREYGELVDGTSAQKYGIQSEDWEKLLSDDQLSDDDLGRLVRRVGAISLSLRLLAKLLDNYAEFSQLAPPTSDDVRFRDYLMRIGVQRPHPDKTSNNNNDALNLAQTSNLRSRGFEAYLVTTTRAVLDTEDRYTREPFYFGLELAVRRSTKNLKREAASNRVSSLISRLTQVITYVQQYGDLISASTKDHRTDLQHEIAVVRSALSGIGSDPVLKEITTLLGDAASALRSASEGGGDSPGGIDNSLPADIATFNKFRSIVNRLSSNLGGMPRVELKRRELSSDYLSYSLLDQEGNMLFAADLQSDDLAIAWATEATVSEFCEHVRSYYAKAPPPEHVTILLRLAGTSKPHILDVSSVGKIWDTIVSRAGDLKVSLLKVICDDNIFWFDTSSLYAFDDPEETRRFEEAKVAVSIREKDQLNQLTDFFLNTSTSTCSRLEAQSNLRKLFSMKGS